MDLKEKYPFIWCPNCNAKQPVHVDEMGADDRNSQGAADLLCGGCTIIIATLHEQPHGT